MREVGWAPSGSIAVMVALILADGDVPPRSDLDLAWPGWADGIEFIVAADGGARHAAALGVAIDLWVGDGDSIAEDALAALEAAGVPLQRSPRHKDESDTELAITAALLLGHESVLILGALGGRVDHALANIGLLAMPELAGKDATILDGRSRTVLIRAAGSDGAPVERLLPGRPGDLVSLLPVGPGVEGVTTRGLAFPLVDEPLPAGRTRGLSNVRLSSDAAVIVRRGLLLVVESPARLST
jgi:thiamine pyrophosphokinase